MDLEEIMNKINTNNKFENIRHIDYYGNECWYAHELQKVKNGEILKK